MTDLKKPTARSYLDDPNLPVVIELGHEGTDAAGGAHRPAAARPEPGGRSTEVRRRAGAEHTATAHGGAAGAADGRSRHRIPDRRGQLRFDAPVREADGPRNPAADFRQLCFDVDGGTTSQAEDYCRWPDCPAWLDLAKVYSTDSTEVAVTDGLDLQARTPTSSIIARRTVVPAVTEFLLARRCAGSEARVGADLGDR
jgi:hypothetical protein